MSNRLEIHGLDLTGMGIRDVVETSFREDLVDLNEFIRQILGSITFGPSQGYVVEFGDDPEDEDDEDWEYAE